MKNLEKLADLFEKEITQDKTGDIFGKVSYMDESKKLYLLAGKITRKAASEKDHIVSQKLTLSAKLILQASDILKKL